MKTKQIENGSIFIERDSRLQDHVVLVVGEALRRKEPSRLCMNEFGNITKIADRNLRGRFLYLGTIGAFKIRK